VTLRLDAHDVITEVSVSNTISAERVDSWVGRPWIETVADSGVERVRRSLDNARRGGLSAFRRILQRFPSGLELQIEYTTVRLGDDAGLIVIGRNLQASSELQSRLIAAQQAMERDYWKLREVEARYWLLFDASNEAVLVLAADDLRVMEANPAAIRALGLNRGWAFLNEITSGEREPFRAMLARVRESGRAPSGVFHLGDQQTAWMIRASLLNDDATSIYMLQLAPMSQPALAPPEADNASLMGVLSPAPAAITHDTQPLLPPLLASAGKTPLKTLVQAAVEVVERHYVEAALRISDGNRTAAAARLGLSRQSLYAKLNRYGLESGSDVTLSN
jgi:transcriptional regulator PpsR